MATTPGTYLDTLSAVVHTVGELAMYDKTLATALPDYGNTVVVGQRGSGKTTLITQLIKTLWAGRLNTAVVVFVGPKDTVPAYTGLGVNVTAQCVSGSEPITRTLKLFWDAHTTLLQSHPECSLVFVFDDVIMHDLAKSTVFHAIMASGKRNRCSTLAGVQYVQDLDAASRREVDVALLLDVADHTQLRVCYVNTQVRLQKQPWAPKSTPTDLPCVLLGRVD